MSQTETDLGALPSSWEAALGPELLKPYYQDLQEFVAAERAEHQVFPPKGEVFTALHLTPFEKVRVVLLGQDPYHDDGQAHGLCFSVKPPVAPPPSLRNMFKELESDLGVPIPTHGNLTEWAQQGLLMLNTVLTVRAHQAASHKDRGWEKFTDAIIDAINARTTPAIFVLWGGHAQKKLKRIDTARHRVIQCAHPSPLSVKKFMGSKPYSQINAQLRELGFPEITWRLTDRREWDVSVRSARRLS